MFGAKGGQTFKAAEEQNKKRGHLLTAYIVSTNEEQLGFVAKMLGSIPCRIYKMKSEDFFSEAEGAYAGMGLDRMAGLRGAISITGLPALVIDGGSAMTYTGIDADGKIMGGGISPGIEMRMKALHEFTFALPQIDLEVEVADIIDKAIKSNTPASIFGKSTKDAMVLSMLNEVSSHLRSVVDVWMEKVGQPKKRKANGNANGNADDKTASITNDDRVAIVTGGGANLVAKLLEEDNGGVIDVTSKKKVRAKQVNGLIHFGITNVLCHQSDRSHITPYIAEDPMGKKHKSDENYMLYVGRSVAKEFSEADPEGEFTYRGQVLSYTVYDAGPYFRVVYTDGDEEDVSLEDVKGMYI